jgi:hypothetical protein
MSNYATIHSRLAVAKARMNKGLSSECKTAHRELGKGEECPYCGKVVLTPKSGEPVARQVEKEAKQIATDQRRKWAEEGVAMPDGSWPIPNRDYLRRAIQSYGRGSKANSRVRAWIMKRARALGAEDMIPEDWK